MLQTNYVRFAGSILFVLSLASSPTPTLAQQPGQRTFTSTEDAGRALFGAMQDPRKGSFLSILGPAGKGVLSSGDASEDLDAHEGFVMKYEQMHRFVTEPNGTVTLVVGAENWPFPIPLINGGGEWYFDTPSGKDEILFRRIGKNEQTAIEACHDLVEAQRQYFTHSPAGQTKQFAARLVSDNGGHDGLYWKNADDELNSPINPLIAFASGRGPEDQLHDQVPFNGYLFRVLTSQGPHAPNGVMNYVVAGKMTRGFAFVAYPVEHGSSGVMTFIVNGSGVVCEKDLGPNTIKLVEAMTAYDPDSTWHRVK